MKKRETELDILRLLAMLAVIWVHVGGVQIETLPATDRNWQSLVFMRGIATWEVPVYVMISGRFFLDPERDVSYKKIRKSIWRLAIAFILWGGVYQAYYLISGAYSNLNWKGILSQAFIGPYHFWYLWMLAGLYAITPFLRKIVQDKKLMEYFIVLYLAMQFLTQYGPNIPLIGTTIKEVLTKSHFRFTLGYSGYFVLGYYLHKHQLTDKAEKILYVVGIVMLIAAGCANTFRAISEGFEDVWYTQYLLPNVVIESAAVYTFAVKRLSKYSFSERTVRWITTLADYSFGVYLIHALVIEAYTYLGLTPTLVVPIVMVPLLTVLVFTTSYMIVVLLRKIPYIGGRIT